MRTLLLLLILGLAFAPALGAQTIVNQWPHQGAFAGGLEYASGSVWVADETNDIINEYDRNGNLLQSIAAPIPPSSGLTNPQPIGVGVDPNTGNVWIGDEGEWVYEMTPAGVPTGVSWPTSPAITDVSGVAVDPVTGNIFVSQDSGFRHITEFDQTGAVVSTIDLSLSGSTDPDGLAYNPATDTFLLGEDTGDLIIEVDRAGTNIGQWAMGPLGISPEGLGIDLAAGTVFIGDGFVTISVFEVAGIISGGGFNLTLTNSCPGSGPATASVTGATPNGTVAFAYAFATAPGAFVYGGVPCTGIVLDLVNPILAATVTADGSGNASVTNPNVPGGACGNVWVQAVDIGSCTASNVASYP